MLTPTRLLCALCLLVPVTESVAAASPAAQRSAKRTRKRPTASEARKLPTLGQVPAFSYLDQDGARVTDKELRGHVWLADFIYTSCTTACPIMSARFVQLQRRVTDPNVRFVSFSVDPEHDTPAVLKEYAARWVVDESRWRLLSTDAGSLPQLSQLMAANVQKTGDAKDPIDHSRTFLLVDASGNARGIYDSTEVDDLNQLLEDLDLLAPQPAAAPEEGRLEGEKLFVSLGCRGCHSRVEVATPLGGLLGREVALEGGKKVKADRAYLAESILDPSAKVVAGYPASMPSYAGQISERQLQSLVDFIASLPGQAAQPRRVAIDPVCKMEISVGPDTRKAEHGGKVFYFCSDACFQKFKRSPAKFAN
jgi:protein SCO1/2